MVDELERLYSPCWWENLTTNGHLSIRYQHVSVIPTKNQIDGRGIDAAS